MSARLDEPAAQDDAAIVRGLHRGDRSAWSALYDQYSTRIWRYAARLIGSDGSAVADVVQETFLSAARSARQFDAARGTLWSWLAGITHNLVSNHWRRSARQERLTHIAAENGGLAHWWETTGDDPALPMETAETADLVRLVLSRLPADYAMILAAKYLDELTIADIQRQHGGTSDAVRSKLHRARAEFKSQFKRMSSAERAREVVPPIHEN